MSRRLLLARRAGSGFTIPQQVITLNPTTDGGDLGITKVAPAAFVYNAKAYIGWVDNAGAVKVQAWDLFARAWIGSPTTLATGGEAHAAPSVIVRTSDHRIVVAWALHDSAALNLAISTNPEDASSFSTTNLNGQLGGSADHTYCSLAELTSEGKLYLFYREYTGTVGYIAYSTSSDNGATWATRTRLVKPTPEGSGNVCYWRVNTNWTDRIDILTTNTGREDSRPSSLYHLYWQSAAWHQSDGTTISAAQPFDTSSATLVIDTTAGPSDPGDVCFDGTNPAVVFQQYQSGSTSNDVKHGRWTGSAWSIHTVLNSGGLVAGNRFVAGAALPEPNLVYTAKKVSTKFQAHKATSADGGATWTPTQLTSSSTDRMLFCRVVNGGTGLRAVWAWGSWTSDSVHTLGIEGLT